MTAKVAAAPAAAIAAAWGQEVEGRTPMELNSKSFIKYHCKSHTTCDSVQSNSSVEQEYKYVTLLCTSITMVLYYACLCCIFDACVCHAYLCQPFLLNFRHVHDVNVVFFLLHFRSLCCKTVFFFVVSWKLFVSLWQCSLLQVLQQCRQSFYYLVHIMIFHTAVFAAGITGSIWPVCNGKLQFHSADSSGT